MMRCSCRFKRGKVALDVSIDLPRPRSRSYPAFARVEGRILEKILDKNAQAM